MKVLVVRMSRLRHLAGKKVAEGTMTEAFRAFADAAS
jgi:hypothetical protein